MKQRQFGRGPMVQPQGGSRASVLRGGWSPAACPLQSFCASPASEQGCWGPSPQEARHVLAVHVDAPAQLDGANVEVRQQLGLGAVPHHHQVELRRGRGGADKVSGDARQALAVCGGGSSTTRHPACDALILHSAYHRQKAGTDTTPPALTSSRLTGAFAGLGPLARSAGSSARSAAGASMPRRPSVGVRSSSSRTYCMPARSRVVVGWRLDPGVCT